MKKWGNKRSVKSLVVLIVIIIIVVVATDVIRRWSIAIIARGIGRFRYRKFLWRIVRNG
jgi:hypothetical protein